ncbi:dinitrogenase iron-molybdenum cofactor biosynthesis protein [Halorhodospira halochloris]|uniref:dinitrogenase iron-molybdenum cofactor biosynthesis protein n=1 Tax=Halorhodospira halochloris TaxID=1052 RepID=UPI001EE890B7|nr:dinitrogenase iron-molybdenum cofactor biosynthesis protein [Halorhodospira halochloris]MCG5530528.1 dinitrogenase iron-molybdenum cofactor biosynthesis protein [Halorhodospira halochloris]
MSNELLTRALALRIGLAARQIPEIEVHQLIALLNRVCGAPLDEEKLAAVSAAELRRGARVMHYDGLYEAADAALERACSALRGDSQSEQGDGEQFAGLPEPVEELADVMAIRVACASNSAANLDGHYGSCARFLVFQVLPGEARLIDVRSTAEVASGVARTEKSAARAALIKDCHILYCCSIGPPAAAKVVRAGLMPVKRADGGSAPELMADLADMLNSNPPPWLAKLLGHEQQSRVRYADFAGTS